MISEFLLSISNYSFIHNAENAYHVCERMLTEEPGTPGAAAAEADVTGLWANKNLCAEELAVAVGWGGPSGSALSPLTS